jgi:two-component system NtrC family sensor kinase
MLVVRLRILAIDNEEPVGRAVRRALFGYDVTTVTSGAEALARIRDGERFDAVICDVVMPGMDGHEFAARLDVIAPDLATRTLFLTGDPTAVEKLSGRPVLTKPFEMHLLRSHLEQLAKSEQEPSVSQRPTARPPRGDVPGED